MPRLALATCAALPDLDEDGPLLREALAAHGVDGVPVAWDDPAARWDGYDAVLVRSTWDYTERRDAYLGWARALPVPVLNPADVLAWSSAKTYLRDLAAAGVPVVPTRWFAGHGPEGAADTGELPDDGRDQVVKPTVGAGARGAARWAPEDRAAAHEHLARLRAEAGPGGWVMAQPYLAGVDTEGETALVFLGGGFSHAVRKGQILWAGTGEQAMILDKDEREVIEPRSPTAAQLAVAEVALAAVPGGADRLAYARVDLVPGEDGAPVVLELELVEPSLFLQHGAPGATPPAERLAAHLAGRLGA